MQPRNETASMFYLLDFGVRYAVDRCGSDSTWQVALMSLLTIFASWVWIAGFVMGFFRLRLYISVAKQTLMLLTVVQGLMLVTFQVQAAPPRPATFVSGATSRHRMRPDTIVPEPTSHTLRLRPGRVPLLRYHVPKSRVQSAHYHDAAAHLRRLLRPLARVRLPSGVHRRGRRRGMCRRGASHEPRLRVQ